MNWHVITVSSSDLGLALGGIKLGGGTVTAARPSGDEVAITYVTDHDRVGTARAELAGEVRS